MAAKDETNYDYVCNVLCTMKKGGFRPRTLHCKTLCFDFFTFLLLIQSCESLEEEWDHVPDDLKVIHTLTMFCGKTGRYLVSLYDTLLLLFLSPARYLHGHNRKNTTKPNIHS